MIRTRKLKPGEYIKEINGIKIYFPNFEKFRDEYTQIREENITYAERVKEFQSINEKVLHRRFKNFPNQSEFLQN